MSVEVKRSDFLSATAPRWCPGCGCYGVLKGLTQTFADCGIPREKQVVISGIGCSARLPYYLDTYAMHTLHARAPAVATGVKLTRPDLSVWIITGDGDALAIGGNHTLHFMRRNMDLKMLLLNNQIYGLTKGQLSPTSPTGMKTKTSPYGSADNPVHPIRLALSMGASFVARVGDKDPAMLDAVLGAAQAHRGAAFVEVLMNCITFHDGAFEAVRDKTSRAEKSLELVHGQPLCFGANGEFGLRERDGELQRVRIAESGRDRNDLLIHDAHAQDPAMALRISQLGFPDGPLALGVFRQIEAPVYGAA